MMDKLNYEKIRKEIVKEILEHSNDAQTLEQAYDKVVVEMIEREIKISITKTHDYCNKFFGKVMKDVLEIEDERVQQARKEFAEKILKEFSGWDKSTFYEFKIRVNKTLKEIDA